MSTKTLRKRIALIAVSAMGFGLLSAAPSSAAATASTALTATGVARDAVGMTITFTGNAASDTSNTAWTQEYAHYRLVASTATPVDTSNAIAVPTGQVALGLHIGSAATAAEIAARNKGTVDLAHNGTTRNFRPGVYTFLAWVNTTNDSTEAAPGVSDKTVRFSVTVAGAPASIALTSPAASVAASATTNAAYVATIKDANGANTLLGTSETITVRAAYTVGAVVIDTTTALAGSSLATSATTGTALTSSNAVASGNAGYINNWSFALANSLATSTTVAVAGAGLIAGITGASSTLTTISVSYPTSVDVSGGTTFSNTAITIGGTLSSGTYVAPVAQTAATTGYAVKASTVHGLSATFRAVGTEADTFDYTIAALSTTTPLPTGITVGTYTTAAVGASPSQWTNFTITATAATSGSGYKVTIPFSATTNIVYTVTYEAPTVNSTSGTVVMTPASGDTAKALIGSAVTVTATVADQFGKAFAGANVVWSASTRKTTNLASNASTNALGESSYSYTDTVATAGTETFNANVSAPTATTVLLGSTSVAFGLAASVAVNTLTVTSNKAAATTGNLVDAVIIETATLKDASNTALRGIPVTMSISANGYAVSTTLTQWSNSSGQVVMQFAGKTVGTATVTVTAGDKTATDAIEVITGTTQSRAITLSAATVAITGGDTKKITATVRDGYGNVVEGQSLTVSYAGTAGRVAAVGGVIGSTGSTGEDGTLVIDISAALSESGTGTLTVAGTMGNASAATVLLNADGVTALPAKVASATTAATITASDAAALAAAAATAADAAANKSILDAIAAISAKATADKAESDAKIKLLEAQIAAAQAASVAAAEAAADAAAEAIDAGNNAYDSANAATDAADAATAAAQQAGEDAVAAAEAAGAAAVEAAQSAQDAAAEATDAATAATDAANAAAEAADAATAAAQDAADAVAALSVQVTEVVASLKKQITALTNLVIRIQKKVKA